MLAGATYHQPLTEPIIFLCLIRRCAALLLLLCVSSGCHRASYVFQLQAAEHQFEAALGVPGPASAAPPRLHTSRPPLSQLPLVQRALRPASARRIPLAYESEKPAGRTTSVTLFRSRRTLATHSSAAKQLPHPKVRFRPGVAAPSEMLVLRSRGVALLLALLVGGLGVHLAYTG